MSRWLPLYLLLALLSWLGCQSEQADVSPDAGAPPAESAEVLGTASGGPVPVYARDELSDIAAYLPDLDEARLKVAPPVDWHVASRSKDYVARFVFDRQLALPIITVTAEDAAEQDPHNVTVENVAAYAASLAEGLDDKTRAALRSQVGPLQLGDVVVARFVQDKYFRHGSRTMHAEREVLQTIREGRVYRVTLDAHVTTLAKYRADAYAVMATMQFPQAAALQQPQAGTDEPQAAADEAG